MFGFSWNCNTVVSKISCDHEVISDVTSAVLKKYWEKERIAFFLGPPVYTYVYQIDQSVCVTTIVYEQLTLSCL